jgi:hypothetical protein
VSRKSAARWQSHVYEVFPINFVYLSPSKQDKVLASFQGFLNSLNRPLEILALKTRTTVKVEDRNFETTYYKFYLESLGEPLDALLDAAGLKYLRVVEIPRPEVNISRPTLLILRDGSLMKTFTICSLPQTIPAGFLSELYGPASQIRLLIRPVAPEAATIKIQNYMRLLKGIIIADQSAGKTPREDVIFRVRDAEAFYQALASGATRLFELTVNISVTGRDRRELHENLNAVRATLQSRLIKIDAPLFLQREMTIGRFGKRLIVNTETLSAFFPFTSGELTETPGGVFLGINTISGAPIIFNPLLRPNYNMLVVGRTGAGKSFLSKIFLTRLALKHKDMGIYVVDPDGEYVQVGRLLKADRFDVVRGRPLGLDPVRIFGEDQDLAAEAIANITHEPIPGNLQGYLRTLVSISESLEDLYQRVLRNPDEKIRRLQGYLVSLVEGFEKFLVKGKPLQFTKRMIFNLRPLGESHYLKRAASLLIFGRLWHVLDDESFIPRQIPKLVIVDEAWWFMSIPPAAKFLENVARRGRKRNIILLVLTQRPADFLNSDSGRALAESSATRIALGLDESALKLLGEIFELSDDEKEYLLDATPGHGIMIVEHDHYPAYFIAFPEEYKLFTTKPGEFSLTP